MDSNNFDANDSTSEIQEIENLIKALKDDAAEVRAEAVFALRSRDDSRAVLPLIACFKDSDARVRETAVANFGHILDTRAVEPLLEALVDENLRVRASAAFALGQLHDRRATLPLLEAIKKRENQDWDFKSAAKGALTNLGGEEVLLYFLAAYKYEAEYGFNRYEVLQSLANFRDKRALDVLIATFKDKAETDELRRTALFNLGRLGELALPLLLEEANLKDSSMRLAAIQALGKTGHKRAIQSLLKLIKNRNTEVRRVAILTLAESEDERVVKPIIERFGPDKDESVRTCILFALRQLPATQEQIIELLIPAFNDKAPMVRSAAASIARSIRDERIVEFLIKALEDGEYSVRCEARFALREILDRTSNSRAKIALEKDEQTFIPKGGALPRIRAEFARAFRLWEITLPEENVEQRKSGFIGKDGWGIKFIFGIENDVEYLEYVCGHRMLYGEPHVRIFESGEIEQLESESHCYNPNDPEKELKMKTQDERIRQELKQKGLYLWED